MNKSLTDIKLTPKRKEILQRLELFTIEDVLRYYPYRYDIFNDKPYQDWQQNDMVYFRCTIISRPYT